MSERVAYPVAVSINLHDLVFGHDRNFRFTRHHAR